MNKIIISLIMLLTSISFSQVNTTYKDGTDCNCDSINESTPDVISTLSNYKNAMEQQEDARYQLFKLFGKANVKLNSDGTYSLNLDNTNVANNKDALKDAGFKVYSFSNALRKAKNKHLDALKNLAIKALEGSERTKHNWNISTQLPSSDALNTELSKYNAKYGTNITFESLGKLIGIK